MKRLLLLITCLSFSSTILTGQYTKPDSTYGVNGKVLTAVSTANDIPRSAALQEDGKLVVVGITSGPGNSDFAILRYLENGDLDDSFGEGGITRIDFESRADGANAVVIQPDGKIIAGGQSSDNTSFDFSLVRLLPNGTPDSTFGVNGKTITNLSDSYEALNALALQKDGKIVAVGRVPMLVWTDFAVVRYLEDGTLDPDFGEGGVTVTSIQEEDEPRAVAIQDDGKIVVAGYSSVSAEGDFVVTRYNTDGTLDKLFGTGGKVLTDIDARSDLGWCLLITPEGKILVGGSGNNSFFDGTSDITLVQYDEDGELDPSFGNGGIAVQQSTAYNFVASMARQPNGKIIVGATVNNGTSDQIMMMSRFNSDGSPDLMFGDQGLVTSDLPGGNDGASVVLIQRDSRVLLIGDVGFSPNFDFIVERYIADFTLQASVVGITCYGHADGSIVVQASGGIPPYVYSLDGITYQSDPAFGGLAPGTYTITIKDSNGAGVTGSIGPIEIVDAAVPPDVSVDVMDNNLTIQVDGNAQGFLYSVDDGLSYQSTNEFLDLPDGGYIVVVLDGNGCLIFTMPVTILFSSVSHSPDQLGFNLFPNPGDGLFNVEFNSPDHSSLSVDVTDLSGRQVYVSKTEVSSSMEKQIDLRFLSEGCYFLRLTDGVRSGMEKVMIEK